jgi:lysylphosphatidylglycerol synthetase-like protein (DUF2156 family)
MHQTTMGRSAALDVLRRHAQHSSAALALNRDTEHFAVAGIDGVIAYRRAGRRHAIQIGGAYAAPEDQPRLLHAFHVWARAEGRRLGAVQLLGADLPAYAALGYRLGQLGASFSIELDGFATRGRKFEKIRNKLARARRAGITVAEAGRDVPYDSRLAARLDELDACWLAGKGSHTKQIEFMVGERDRPGETLRRLFVAVQDGRPVAYVSYAPVFGRRPGRLYDLTRRDPGCPPGVVELMFVEAVRRFRDEGVGWLHLGLTPFCQISPAHRPAAGGHRGMDRLIGFIAAHGDRIYPARSQMEFKTKWQPGHVEPEYVGFHPRVSAAAVWRLMRLTRTV